MTPKIRFDHVCKSFGSLKVLDDFCLDIGQGEIISIIGPSGSGKTTILRTLMTLESIDDGVIYVDNKPLNYMEVEGKLVPASKKYIRNIRSKIGMVFQSFNLFPHMTALQNCTEAPVYSLGLSKNEADDRATKLLTMVGLGNNLNHYPSQLSGGMQQRVAIARALAMQPEVLLFDEVTSALDPETVGEVLNVIRMLATEHSYTMVMVTHQMGFAKEISNRVCFIHEGKVLEDGRPDEIFSKPTNERTKQFLSAVLEAT